MPEGRGRGELAERKNMVQACCAREKRAHRATAALLPLPGFFPSLQLLNSSQSLIATEGERLFGRVCAKCVRDIGNVATRVVVVVLAVRLLPEFSGRIVFR